MLMFVYHFIITNMKRRQEMVEGVLGVFTHYYEQNTPEHLTLYELYDEWTLTVRYSEF